MDGTTPPFLFGGPIPPTLVKTHFHGFEEERRTLASILGRKSSGHFGVLGETASGKSSLMMAVQGRQSAVPRYLDCSRTWPSNRAAFYRNLLDALDQAVGEFDLSQEPVSGYASFPLPKRGSIGELVLENADFLVAIDPALVDEIPILAARLPFPLVVTGHPQVLAPICPDHVRLLPFSEASTVDFLERRFEASGFRIGLDACQAVFEFSGGRPDAVQRIGSIAWERALRERKAYIDRADIDAAVADAVERLPSYALAGWANVRGIMRDIFIAMCLLDLNSPTKIANRLGLEPKSVIVLLGRLQSAHQLVSRNARGKYEVRDALLKHYVRKEWGSPVLR